MSLGLFNFGGGQVVFSHPLFYFARSMVARGMLFVVSVKVTLF